jgi:anti-anti-sigma regulatory factor
MKQTKRKRANVNAPAAAITTTASGQVIAHPQLAAMTAASCTKLQTAAEDSTMSGTNNDPTINTAHGADHAQPHMYALTASCTVRDSLGLKSALLDLLMDKSPVTIDVRAVERIDTAALQVLCAFVRDRKAAGGNVLWIGCTESFSDAIRLLGLQQVLQLTDAQLKGAAA